MQSYYAFNSVETFTFKYYTLRKPDADSKIQYNELLEVIHKRGVLDVHLKTRLPVSLGEIASSLRNILSALHVCHSLQWNSEFSFKKGFNYF